MVRGADLVVTAVFEVTQGDFMITPAREVQTAHR
jgi:hypothetical protein